MERIKADILINGSLICKEKLGGGKIYSCKKEKLDEWFDTHNAVVIDGDVLVGSFNSACYTVVVTGNLASGGTCHELQ